MLLQQAHQTMPDENELTMKHAFKCRNLITANWRQKLKKGRNKSKQSKARNTSRWPRNGKQVGLVAKWQGLRWGSIVLAAVLQEKHFSSLVWATLFPHSAVVLTLAGQDRRQARPNEKQTPFTPVLPISPCGFFVFKEKKNALQK